MISSKAWYFLSQTLDRLRSKFVNRQQASSLSFGCYDLVDMFENPGCAVCNLLLRDADRSLDHILYELTLDADIHRAFRARRGLCNEHSWLALQYKGMSLGVAILYKVALDEVLQVIEETPPDGDTGGPRLFDLRRKPGKESLLAKCLEPTEPCIVCKLVAEAEEHYIRVLSEHVADSRLSAAYQSSDGLCLPHFRQALLSTPDPSRRRQLVSIQKTIWSRLQADLKGMIDKSNYLHNHEITQVEGISWRRAIRIAGERGVFGPDRRENP